MEKMKVIIRGIIFIPIGIITYPLALLATTMFGIMIMTAGMYSLLWVIYPLLSDGMKDEVKEASDMLGMSLAMPALFWYCMVRYGSPNAPN